MTPTVAPPGAWLAPSRLRLARNLCFIVPAVVLAASYAWLALDHGTLLLWNVVIHESGRYTLGQTVLYFDHFLREVPVAIGYALFLLAISGNVTDRAARGAARVARYGWLVVAVALIGGALFVSARAHGWDSALRDLLQYRTRDDLAGYGTHWRYHWLSTLWFGAAAGVTPVVARRALGVSALRPHAVWTRVAWGYFLTLTVVFGVSADVFLDVRYAGHQAREILTHGPITLLLGIGVLLAAGRSGAGSWLTPGAAAGSRLVWVLLALVLVIPLYLAVISLGGDLMGEGQTEYGLGAMVAGHYFEHTLDYGLVLTLLGAGLARAGHQT